MVTYSKGSTEESVERGDHPAHRSKPACVLHGGGCSSSCRFRPHVCFSSLASLMWWAAALEGWTTAEGLVLYRVCWITLKRMLWCGSGPGVTVHV